jgi:phosphatidylserine/phosphatidylglycerophosphate/cardiolipin synthase-like enzyme
MNNRNHRKIVVIDGQVGYIGGFNVGDDYLGLGKLGYGTCPSCTCFFGKYLSLYSN